MKIKLSLTIFLSLVFGLLSSQAQVPQGFNYQAVARLTTGDPIINTTLPVRITIQADSLGTAIIWQELHNPVTTNGFGLMTLVLGKGARQAVSTVPTFSAINWSVTPKFIKTEIDYGGWKTMGVTRLWAVPFATVAGDLAGSVKKLSVSGQTSINDEALFEVRNKSGQLVFAVYNEGVRIYVSDGAKGLKGGFAVGGFGTDKGVSTPYFVVGKDSVRVYLDTNPLTKKLKGGFAVGGYDLTKGIVVQDYLDVNSDSVRIYIDSDPTTKKLKGGFAVGGYDMTKGTNTNYMNVNADTSVIIKPSQNRIYWYPLKNAFLTGRVVIEKPDSVGTNSFASGFESKAKGQYSQALGYKAIARGDYSTAIGKYAVANNINSFALGENAIANNSQTYAFGNGTHANALGSFAFGYNAKATGQDAFAFGSGTEAIGQGSFAIGFIGRDSAGAATGNTRAVADWSMAFGMGTQATEKGAFAMGTQCIASAPYSIAAGYFSRVDGWYGIALGYNSVAKMESDVAIGYRNEAWGMYATALGAYSKSSGYGAFAAGLFCNAGQPTAIAMGDHAKAYGEHSIAIGTNPIANGTISTAIGSSVKTTKAYSTAIGFHASAFGTGSTSLGNNTIASGNYSSALGYYTNSKSYGSFAVGIYNDTTLFYSSSAWDSRDPIFIVGNGTSNSARKDAFTVYKNGNAYIQGNLGIGTTAPSARLHVANNLYVGSGTFTNPEGWGSVIDLNDAGTSLFQIRSGSAEGRLMVHSSGWWGSPAGAMVIGTKTYNSLCLATNSNLRMTLNQDGLVGIGTTTPSQVLEVNGNIQISANGFGVWLRDETTGTNWQLHSHGNVLRMFNGTTETIVGTQTSSRRFKDSIKPMENILEKINQLQGVTFTWKTGYGKGGNDLGFIAEEVGKVFPALVTYEKNGTDAVALNYPIMSAIAIEGIKELSAKNTLMEQQIANQQQEIDELKALVKSLVANHTKQENYNPGK